MAVNAKQKVAISLGKTLLTDGFRPLFAGTDSYTAGQIHDKDFTVPDLACARAFDNGIDRRLNEIIVDRYLQAELSKQIPCFLYAAVKLISAYL